MKVQERHESFSVVLLVLVGNVFMTGPANHWLILNYLDLVMLIFIVKYLLIILDNIASRQSDWKDLPIWFTLLIMA